MLARPNEVSTPSRGSAFWARTLSWFTEIDDGQFSRYDSSTGAFTFHHFILTATPPSLLVHLDVYFPETADPRYLPQLEISCHAPIGCTWPLLTSLLAHEGRS